MLNITPEETIAERLTSNRDMMVKRIAQECRDEVVTQITELIIQKQLTSNQLFDTFYIPIPDTNPQKYNTQYDSLTDIYLLHILDKHLARDKNLIFVVAVDRNGYLPTHNSKYSRFLTGDGDQDTKTNRTKRIFNDRTGLAAARNTKEYLLQKYNRDTGESLADLSVPIFINQRHWGAIRIGYFRED
ncbi:MAG: chemotaxis protein [Desulfobacteraceae bacterium]|nr:chemotaxis protein [Desulfobacteraceae bacterium]